MALSGTHLQILKHSQADPLPWKPIELSPPDTREWECLQGSRKKSLSISINNHTNINISFFFFKWSFLFFQTYMWKNDLNWQTDLQFFGPSCVTHTGHILICGKKPDTKVKLLYPSPLRFQ